MKKVRYEFARRKARRLRRKCEQDAPYLDLEIVVEFVGADLHERSLTDTTSGMLIVQDGAAAIVINSEHHVNRQRFTTAHEIGHLLLHAENNGTFVDGRRNRDQVSSEGRDPDEIEANTFAAELLMPEPLVRAEAAEAPTGDEFLPYMAKRFGVSEGAMSIALTRLKLLDPLYD